MSGEVPISHISPYIAIMQYATGKLAVPMTFLEDTHQEGRLCWVGLGWGFKSQLTFFFYFWNNIPTSLYERRGDLLFSLQIICPFCCCSEISTLLLPVGLLPTSSVGGNGGTKSAQPRTQGQGETEERVCQRAEEWSGRHRLAAAN